MTAAHRSPEPSPRRARRPWAGLPVVAACGLIVGACMLFTAPVPADQPSIEAPEAQPSLAPEPAQPQVEGEVIGSYRAISQSTDENRAENVRLAAETIDGVVIAPGETFSFNDCVGNTEEDERYRLAPVIYGNEMADGRGGGICQVSTALYIAALKANLEIVERHPHSIASDYAPVGLDATLVYGVMDLRIKNAGADPVRIDAVAVGQTVEVSIVGKPLEDGLAIDATSKIIDRYVDGAPGSNLHYVTEAYRVYYQDGVKSYSDLISSDSYLVLEPSSIVLSEGSVDPTK